MKANEIRTTFLNYFEQKGHTVVPGSSLIPTNDPTLLFTNAGMNQFKDVFLGKETRPYTKAASAQCCVRAGGKHNDLENVGYTTRHHTFFEMLGNFSFGDYFKRDAINYAWEFLTKILKIPPEKLWVTVFKEDKEAEKIWLEEIKIDSQRFRRCGVKDNFWSMGETGPCGPCSEIFYDHGPDVSGRPPGSSDQEGDRYVEIWNLVFMQYDRSADGKMNLLPKPSVDTGMGLERITAAMQGVYDNYETDLFAILIKDIQNLAKIKPSKNSSVKVIADHIRSSVFLIADGVVPSNEGRGYVLRRIIRRALRHGHKLGIRDTFFYKLVEPVVQKMSEAYPKILQSQKMMERILYQEEEQFLITLDQGLKILEQEINLLSSKVIPGQLVFQLYDTYGFPRDLTEDIAKERGVSIDQPGFEQAMEKQRLNSQQASKFSLDYGKRLQIKESTVFVGYEKLMSTSKITKLFKDERAVESLKEDDEGIILLDSTPFYAESGGQVGDIGKISTEQAFFRVTDTQKQGDAFLHFGKVVKGTFALKDKVSAEVNPIRIATAANHSATHLLHNALRQVLGSHVEQKGSLVSADRLRFDFSHFEPINDEQIKDIERIVNWQIRSNLPVITEIMSLQDAKDAGIIALFGEKYGEQVRVVSIGDISRELCGGTHVQASGEIGLFKILSETGIAAGVRRIEAITGENAIEYIEKVETRLKSMAALLKTGQNKILEKLQQTIEQNRIYGKELEQLKSKFAVLESGDLAEQAIDVKGIKVLAVKLEGADSKTLRNTVDQLKQKLGSAVIALASIADDKAILISGVSNDMVNKLHAGRLMQYLASQVGGKGGGRPDMAQGGGVDIKAIDSTLNSVVNWVKKNI